MTTILKQLLAKRGILSMEEQAADADKDKEQVGDGGSTPDGSEANPEEVTPTTPPEEVPPTEEVPSKEEEEEPGAEEAGAEEPGEAEPAPAEGEEPEPTPAEGGEQEPAPETPNPDEGGAEPAGEEDDDFDDEDDSDEDGDFDEDELDDTVEELTETQKADLAMINLIDKVRETLADGGLSGREATMVADRAGAILGKIEIEASPTPSMECFGSFGDRRTSTQLTLEALQEDQKAVEQKKGGLISKLIDLVKKILDSLFGNKARFEQLAKDAREEAKKVNEERSKQFTAGEIGYVASLAILSGKNEITATEMTGLVGRLQSDLDQLVHRASSELTREKVESGFIAELVDRTQYLKRIGTDLAAYRSAVEKMSDDKVTLRGNGVSVGGFVAASEKLYNATIEKSNNLRKLVTKACEVGNGDEVRVLVGVVSLVGRIVGTYPAVAVSILRADNAKEA